MAINDAGQVVVTAFVNGSDKAFVWKDGKFTLMALPGTNFTIEAGSISPWGLVVGDIDTPPYGFAYSTLQQRAYSLNIRHWPTLPTAINSVGQVTGSVKLGIGDFPSAAFLYRYGQYTILNPPGSKASFGKWLNDSGQVVGEFYDAGGFPHGFSYLAGRYDNVAVPSASETDPLFVNAAGDIIGRYLVSSSTGSLREHGFVYSRGAYKTVDYPGAEDSMLLSLNSHGEAIGMYGDGYVFRVTGGKAFPVRPALDTYHSYTYPGGLNKAGWFVGDYSTALPSGGTVDHPFVAICDPPQSRCGD